MQLHPGETPAGPWRELDAGELRDTLRPYPLILVDGGSGSGKSTLADRVAELLDAQVVRTDDVAWHHDPIDWDTELIDNVISPWRVGRPIRYRPPGWQARHRPGAITVPPAARLVIEGVGAARTTLAALADLVIWVQADRTLARERGLARDVELGRTPAEARSFWSEWMSAEEPFLAAEQPWRNAQLIIDGGRRGGTATWAARGPAERITER